MNGRKWLVAAVAAACGVGGLLSADDGRIYFWSAFGVVAGLGIAGVYLDWFDHEARQRK